MENLGHLKEAFEILKVEPEEEGQLKEKLKQLSDAMDDLTEDWFIYCLRIHK